jgi:pimeloyl-ACP methyl ester carboxylesterase
MKKIFFIMLLTVAAFSGITTQAQVKNIGLVHGAFADGSGWQKVYTILKAHGYKVSIAGNPNTELKDDVAATKKVLDRQDGPFILVGHSYGGAIITVVGNSSNVAGLVYVSAFAPGTGEVLGELPGTFPVDPLPGIFSLVDGFAWYDPEKYHSGFSLSIYF